MKSKKDRQKSSHKDKKKHKKVRRRKSSSSSSISTSDEKVEWVEKTVSQSEEKCMEENSMSSSKKEQELVREEWMNLGGIFPCAFSTSNEKKVSIKKKEDNNSSILDKPGQSTRELNPHWKDGGNGLPQMDSGKLATDKLMDAAWLKKSLQRAKEQAEVEGKSLHEIAAERWGSLSTIESMIAKAERKTTSAKPWFKDRNEKYEKRYNLSEERTQKKVYKKPTDEDYYRHSDYKSSQVTAKNWQKKKDRTDDTVSQLLETPKVKESTSVSCSSHEKSSGDGEVLSEAELNKLGARIVKAEIMGDNDLAAKLKAELEKARKVLTESNAAKKVEAANVILARTDSKGITRPIEQRTHSKDSARSKRRKVATHESGERVRHYFDDDKYSLQQLFQREKGRSVDDDDAAIAKIVSKNMDMNEIFEEQITRSQSEARQDAKERAVAINEHKRLTKSLENCRWCVDSKYMLKHMIVAMDSLICLSLPSHTSLTKGHCILTPVQHIACQLQLDENIWEQLKKYKQALCKMFAEKGEYPVFFEVYKTRSKFSHMQLECVPLPSEVGESAPMYFKKALLECETEWSVNKKVIDLKHKSLRQAVPVGLSYFVVQFGIERGYAHVIEDAQMFPSNFAEEIIGGMLDLDHDFWRKPKKDSFEEQREKVLQFTEVWKKYKCEGE